MSAVPHVRVARKDARTRPSLNEPKLLVGAAVLHASTDNRTAVTLVDTRTVSMSTVRPLIRPDLELKYTFLTLLPCRTHRQYFDPCRVRSRMFFGLVSFRNYST